MTDWQSEAAKWQATGEDPPPAPTADSPRQQEALDAARAEGHTAAAREYGTKLAAAELKAAAVAKGLDLAPLGDLIDPARFVSDTGEVDSDAIADAAANLGKIHTRPPLPPRGSGEFSGSPVLAPFVTESQLARMAPDHIVRALRDGKLNHLL